MLEALKVSILSIEAGAFKQPLSRPQPFCPRRVSILSIEAGAFKLWLASGFHRAIVPVSILSIEAGAFKRPPLPPPLAPQPFCFNPLNRGGGIQAGSAGHGSYQAVLVSILSIEAGAFKRWAFWYFLIHLPEFQSSQ